MINAWISIRKAPKVQKGVDKMKINMKLLTAALVLAGAVVLTSVARADTVSIGLKEAGFNGGAVFFETSGSGSASFSGSYGTFILNSVIGVGTPPLGEPSLDSSSIDVSSSASGTLSVYVTESGITSVTGVNNFLSGFTMNLLSAGWTVTESTYVDLGNGVFAITSPLGSQVFTAIGSASSINATPSLGSPFSETEVFTITATGTGSSDGTITMSRVPEPATLSLLGMGLLSLLGLRKKVRG